MPENNNIQEVENKSRVELLLEAWAGGEQIELWEPQSNIERILMNILGATGVDINPIQSRNEALLLEILENGGGSGGGGSSDFSAAEVTLNLTLPEGLTAEEEFLATCFLPYPDFYTAPPYICDYVDAVNHKVILPLYQGKAYFVKPAANANAQSYSITDPSDVSLSGSVTFDTQMRLFYVTGDCTITATLVLGE